MSNPNPNYNPDVDARDRDQGQPGAMKAAGEVMTELGTMPTYNEPHIAKELMDYWNRQLGPATGHGPLTTRFRVILDVSIADNPDHSTVGVMQLMREIIPS